MKEVVARSIHVGDRYEALTPVERIDALLADERYPALLEGDVEQPEAGSLHLVAGVFLVFMAFWVCMLTAGSDAQPEGIASALALLIGGTVVAFWRPGLPALDEAELVPAYVRSKDYVSRASREDPAAGAFAVELITRDDDLLQVELAQGDSDMLAVGDVGVAGIRGDRLMDFRMLDGWSLAVDMDELEAARLEALAGRPVTDPRFAPSDNRGAVV